MMDNIKTINGKVNLFGKTKLTIEEKLRGVF